MLTRPAPTQASRTQRKTWNLKFVVNDLNWESEAQYTIPGLGTVLYEAVLQ
jgi:hypothetical protein